MRTKQEEAIIKQVDGASLADVASVNASILYGLNDSDFVARAIARLTDAAFALLVSDDPEIMPSISPDRRMTFVASGLNDVPVRFDVVRSQLTDAFQKMDKCRAIIVDMRWGMGSVSAAANFERWGGQCDRLVAQLDIPVISIYRNELLVEDQLLAAFRGHSHFLSPSGAYSNPFWLPPEYLTGASLTKQAQFLLGRIVPEYSELALDQDKEENAASGANPGWIATRKRIAPRSGSDDIWKIRCFGRLRIYLSDGTQLQWDIQGSSPKRSKALFACLLHYGERGARSDELAELLWDDDVAQEVKRSRLHHAIAMLRKTLGGTAYVARTGEYYSLVPPSGTWIDVANFEQLCQKAKILAKSGMDSEAVQMLDAADRLYTGDLFEDMPTDLTDTDGLDWVVPRRMWFKEMSLKVLRDKAEIMRRKGRLREALVCCQKALRVDPACEMAHAEAMKVFHAQNRSDAVARQYRQYRSALAAVGAPSDSDELADLCRRLVQVDENKRL